MSFPEKYIPTHYSPRGKEEVIFSSNENQVRTIKDQFSAESYCRSKRLQGEANVDHYYVETTPNNDFVNNEDPDLRSGFENIFSIRFSNNTEGNIYVFDKNKSMITLIPTWKSIQVNSEEAVSNHRREHEDQGYFCVWLANNHRMMSRLTKYDSSSAFRNESLSGVRACGGMYGDIPVGMVKYRYKIERLADEDIGDTPIDGFDIPETEYRVFTRRDLALKYAKHYHNTMIEMELDDDDTINKPTHFKISAINTPLNKSYWVNTNGIIQKIRCTYTQEARAPYFRFEYTDDEGNFITNEVPINQCLVGQLADDADRTSPFYVYASYDEVVDNHRGLAVYTNDQKQTLNNAIKLEKKYKEETEKLEEEKREFKYAQEAIIRDTQKRLDEMKQENEQHIKQKKINLEQEAKNIEIAQNHNLNNSANKAKEKIEVVESKAAVTEARKKTISDTLVDKVLPLAITGVLSVGLTLYGAQALGVGSALGNNLVSDLVSLAGAGLTTSLDVLSGGVSTLVSAGSQVIEYGLGVVESAIDIAGSVVSGVTDVISSAFSIF